LCYIASEVDFDWAYLVLVGIDESPYPEDAGYGHEDEVGQVLIGYEAEDLGLLVFIVDIMPVGY
jgi:hypothetical protein